MLVMGMLPVAAQRLSVIKGTVDVGHTGYQQPVTAVFELKNKGIRKLRIDEVKADCACTAIDYPKQEIGMNEKFTIRMTYDARMLGHFDKQAAIYSNGSKKPVYIRMKGVVVTDIQDFEGSYPIEMGDLRTDRRDIEFDDVNKGDHPTQELHIFNNGTGIFHPNLMHLPPYLTALVTPERLAPGHAGKITITLNSELIHDYGLTQTTVYLAANPGDKISQDKEMTVSTILLPGFDTMSPESRLTAPKLQLSKEAVDIVFGNKGKKSDIIDLTNTGQTELTIRSLQMFTGGLKISLGKRSLQPGETTRLKITAQRDELRKVRTQPRILMITNDPGKPKVVININVQ